MFLLYIKLITRAYVTSSGIIYKRNGYGGMPEKILLSRGVIAATAIANGNGNINPASKIGKCIGKNVLPAPIERKRIGSNMPNATNKLDQTIFLTSKLPPKIQPPIAYAFILKHILIDINTHYW